MSILDSSFVIDLFADGMRAKVLAGDSIVVMPAGEHHRRGKVRDITPAIVQDFADNYAHRLERGIRRQRVAVDVDHKGGAVGWYNEVAATPDGVMASFTWNKRGRALLEGDE
ncbi:unnamed protein product, partial [marine sediment metagenome]